MDFPKIILKQPALVLAPMEGVTDAPMRTLLTERGGLSFCVSEFLRINNELVPDHIFYSYIPELKNSCKTPFGVPIQVQLLGSNEEMMALNAQRACRLGAQAIDINFGCPSPLVNHNHGGASLLRYPDRIQSIVRAVREALPLNIPVSAKLRLGWQSLDDIFVNAEKAFLGGASWITIHARTKMQGYAPPVHWKYIGEVKKQLQMPILANGDIWTFEDFLRCQEETQCDHFMVGRGAVGNPSLIHKIACHLNINSSKNTNSSFSQSPQDWEPLLIRFAELSKPIEKHPSYTVSRMKQWLKFATLKHSLPWFDEIKRSKSLEELFLILNKYIVANEIEKNYK